MRNTVALIGTDLHVSAHTAASNTDRLVRATPVFTSSVSVATRPRSDYLAVRETSPRSALLSQNPLNKRAHQRSLDQDTYFLLSIASLVFSMSTTVANSVSLNTHSPLKVDCRSNEITFFPSISTS